MSDLFRALARVLGIQTEEVEGDDEIQQMIPASEAISEAVFDPENKTLAIQFVSGSSYLYENVSRQRFRAFENAASKGRYFVYRIRENYSYSQIG
jgi:hypothetical protein